MGASVEADAASPAAAKCAAAASLSRRVLTGVPGILLAVGAGDLLGFRPRLSSFLGGSPFESALWVLLLPLAVSGTGISAANAAAEDAAAFAAAAAANAWARGVPLAGPVASAGAAGGGAAEVALAANAALRRSAAPVVAGGTGVQA